MKQRRSLGLLAALFMVAALSRAEESASRFYPVSQAQGQYIAELLRTDEAERFLAERRPLSQDIMA